MADVYFQTVTFTADYKGFGKFGRNIDDLTVFLSVGKKFTGFCGDGGIVKVKNADNIGLTDNGFIS